MTMPLQIDHDGRVRMSLPDRLILHAHPARGVPVRVCRRPENAQQGGGADITTLVSGQAGERLRTPRPPLMAESTPSTPLSGGRRPAPTGRAVHNKPGPHRSA